MFCGLSDWWFEERLGLLVAFGSRSVASSICLRSRPWLAELCVLDLAFVDDAGTWGGCFFGVVSFEFGGAGGFLAGTEGRFRIR